jgi:hypothetical protein
MKSMARWIGVAVSFAWLVSSPAAAAGNEVILVEPLNATLYFGIFQSIYQQPAVMRPETICGNPGGSATNLVKCFEFAMTYFTYDAADGRQRAHLPQCNAVGPLDADCEDPTNDLCAGNTTLDPFQILAPVCGEVRVDVLPLTSPDLLVLAPQSTGAWDGTSTTNRVVYFDFIGADGRARPGRFILPLIRIPASQLNSLLVLLVGRHTALSGDFFDFGFFNVINRVFPYNETLGDATNLIAEPLLMTR